MCEYELTVVINPEVGEEDLPATLEKVNQFITQKGGSIIEVNQWGRRRLAYPINHLMEGNYVLTQFRLEPRFVTGLKENLRSLDQILRYLIIKIRG